MGIKRTIVLFVFLIHLLGVCGQDLQLYFVDEYGCPIQNETIAYVIERTSDTLLMQKMLQRKAEETGILCFEKGKIDTVRLTVKPDDVYYYLFPEKKQDFYLNDSIEFIADGFLPTKDIVHDKKIITLKRALFANEYELVGLRLYGSSRQIRKFLRDDIYLKMIMSHEKTVLSMCDSSLLRILKNPLLKKEFSPIDYEFVNTEIIKNNHYKVPFCYQLLYEIKPIIRHDRKLHIVYLPIENIVNFKYETLRNISLVDVISYNDSIVIRTMAKSTQSYIEKNNSLIISQSYFVLNVNKIYDILPKLVEYGIDWAYVVRKDGIFFIDKKLYSD